MGCGGHVVDDPVAGLHIRTSPRVAVRSAVSDYAVKALCSVEYVRVGTTSGLDLGGILAM